MREYLYMAYGSNLNKEQMSLRCPKAIPLKTIYLPNWRLVFRGVADITEAKGFCVPIVLWQITKDCEKSLDRYEGFPNLYRKEFFHNSKTDELMMAYIINDFSIGKPPIPYFQSILEGYQDFNINDKYLFEAERYSREYETGKGYIPKKYRPNLLLHD